MVCGLGNISWPLRRFARAFTNHYCLTDFDVVISPKRKLFKWVVNIEGATLEGLKNSIREMYKLPALENDGAVLNFVVEGGRHYPRNDNSF